MAITLGLQVNSLTLDLLMENQEMMLGRQNPFVKAQVVSKSDGYLQQPYVDVYNPLATNELSTPRVVTNISH